MEALDKFKVFKTEVENRHDLKIKIVRSDRGGVLQLSHPLWPSSWTFCEVPYGNSIVAQYSTLGETQQNGVAERRNRTLMDMIRSMNYGQEENPRLITFMCGAIHLRLRYLIQTLGN